MIVQFDVMLSHEFLDFLCGVIPGVVLYPEVTVVVPVDDDLFENLKVNVLVGPLVFFVV